MKLLFCTELEGLLHLEQLFKKGSRIFFISSPNKLRVTQNPSAPRGAAAARKQVREPEAGIHSSRPALAAVSGRGAWLRRAVCVRSTSFKAPVLGYL